MSPHLATAAIMLTLSVMTSSCTEFNQGRKVILGATGRPSRVVNPLPRYHSDLPSQWLWNDIRGVNYLTQLRNQHLPTYCGSCWAFAATSSLSDRIKIARRAAWPDINVSPQIILSCAPDAGDGCHGGDSGKANQWMHNNDVTDETCSIYQARGHDNGLPCSSLELCENCMSFDDNKCTSPSHFYRYRVDEFADVKGDDPVEQEKNMRAEIFHRGPISCGIAVTKELLNYTGGIFRDWTNNTELEHDISVVGYGIDRESGQKYWLIRNSWGSYWGEGGFFKLTRGINNLGIESGVCSWATPRDTWSNASVQRKATLEAKEKQERTELNAVNEITEDDSFLDKLFKIIHDFVRRVKLRKSIGFHKGCSISHTFRHGPVIKSPLPQDYVSNAELPKNWDWRNVSGKNYLSWTVNQHIPHYCGSCWAQGPASALADRFIISDPDRFANLALSPQVILNCQAGGSCHGGNPTEVYAFAKNYGIPDQTCQPYDALDHGTAPAQACQGEGLSKRVCKDCSGPAPKPGQEGNCWPKKHFKRYHASEFGDIRGAENIKKELYKRGPISCGLEVTNKFLAYSGGIFSEKNDNPQTNHEVSLVGYGLDESTGEEFWVGRNSWGTYWGEYGFFRIKMHEDNQGIENFCSWGVPDLNV